MEDKLALVARAMGEHTETTSVRKAGLLAVELVFDLMVDVNIPTSLKEMGFIQEDLSEMVDILVTCYPKVNNPRPMSREDSFALSKSMWKGKLNYQ